MFKRSNLIYVNVNAVHVYVNMVACVKLHIGDIICNMNISHYINGCLYIFDVNKYIIQQSNGCIT